MLRRALPGDACARRRAISLRFAHAMLAVTSLMVMGTGIWLLRPLPDGLLDAGVAPGYVIEDRDGMPLRTARAQDGSRMHWLPLSEVDADLVRAFIAAEDRRFHDHAGVDIRAVVRAGRDNLLARRVVSGASTITMQTARLLRPSAPGFPGKVHEALWALRLELHLDKQRILEQYLNRVHLGQGTAGVEAAASLYLSASARQLSAGQAAMLAGLARAPSRDNPIVSTERAGRRRGNVLARMQQGGYLTADEVARASEEEVLARHRITSFHAPHFTTRVIASLEQAGGRERRVRTSLDLALQRALEVEVRHAVGVLHDRGARHAAAVVLDNATGEVLAWVGSPDFWESRSGQTDMVVSARQPGSALKPFLFALALDRGTTAATILPDVARTFPTPTGPYRPRNYDQRFRGPVRVREALGSSYNVPAVYLTEAIGAARLLETLHNAGFASLRRSSDHYGLGLSLGNGDVTLLETANAYRTLANGGVWRPYRWTLTGDRVSAGPEQRVASPQAAAIVLDILSDPAARVGGFGMATPFEFAYPTAVKTGTSRHFTDNWAVAVTAGFTVAVWVGNFSGRPMQGVSGVSGAGPLLQRAVLLTAARHDPGVLTTPAQVGAVVARICALSGKRATAHCPHAVEWFIPGTEPEHECDWHTKNGVTLPPEYAEWSQQLARPNHRIAVVDSAASEEQRFRIVSPQHGDRYAVPPNVEARYASVGLLAAGGAGPEGVAWFANGERVRSGRLRLTAGEHLISARSRSGESHEVLITIE
jgi:penicillin-binding protein 1C